MPQIKDIITAYLIIVNLAGFILILADKIKARHRAWRIPENTLMIVSAIGGSIGTFAAMHFFRHKTRQSKFSIGVPILMTIHVLFFTVIYSYL